MPKAVEIGINYFEFWQMNPRAIKLVSKGVNDKLQNQLEYDNFMAYITGIYFVEALRSTVGNMFSKKGAKPYEYPKEPLNLSESSKRELTEEEKEVQRKMFLDSLFQMQENFERNKKGEA